MRFILVSIGSMGDTLPFILLGKRLLERGHDVQLIASGYFREMTEKVGLELIESSSAERFMEFVHGQRNWSTGRALKEMMAELLALTPVVYEELRQRLTPSDGVVAAQGYAFGARVAQEKLGLRLATVHLQPLWFRSPMSAAGPSAKFPLWLIRMVDRLLDGLADRQLGAGLNKFRASLGLSPVQRILRDWWNSPEQVLGLFPDWYAPIKPDFPPHSVLAGFPLDRSENQAFSPEVEEFLNAGDAPLVFSQSSVTVDVDYLHLSAEVAKRLGRRAILLTPYPELVPKDLPSHVRYFRYVPLAQLLPRTLLHIHHGGVGTIAHTLAAGIPQLTVPMVFDQTDNSRRLVPLGVSAFLKRSQYQPDRVAKIVRELLESPSVSEACRLYARRSAEADGLDSASKALETLATCGTLAHSTS